MRISRFVRREARLREKILLSKFSEGVGFYMHLGVVFYNRSTPNAAIEPPRTQPLTDKF